jgi:hypothetical protein
LIKREKCRKEEQCKGFQPQSNFFALTLRKVNKENKNKNNTTFLTTTYNINFNKPKETVDMDIYHSSIIRRFGEGGTGKKSKLQTELKHRETSTFDSSVLRNSTNTH